MERIMSAASFLSRTVEGAPGHTCRGREERCENLPVLLAKHAEGISLFNMKGVFEYENSRKFQWKRFKFTDRPTFW